MKHFVDLTSVSKQDTRRLSDQFFGKSPDGTEIGFTNYYMIKNGKPFFGISGEFHFSRVSPDQWENTILKMKAGGINTIATYVFWIHHEEVEGRFCFDGRRNLRKFVELCGRHGMYVIVRIGPFSHGEVRNGGLPDWLYGKPYEVRSNDEGFLHSVRLYYRAISEQLSGLYFKDGGPVIAAQMDNEYMHSAAPWEMTTGISNEWMTVGNDGDSYLLNLKRIAVEEGIVTPFYTCTGWGGAATPTEELMPLWGGYAYWPWIFHSEIFDHPATPEYIYRDNHNRAVTSTYNFEPFYDPESMPYACCEMGGGMSVCYNYRFRIDYESVDAMANVKLGSGCNFLGYYMYRGGTNPRGERTPFLNESHCAKISYDYQAPIGEFGQIRPSFHRLRALHLFLKHYADSLCDLVTVLPEGSQDIDPADTRTLRYAVRTDGKRGYLFLNNYQDHAVCIDKKNETIQLHTEIGDVLFEDVSLAAGESAILPFHMDLDGLHLICATAQPLAFARSEKKTIYYFFTPEGMRAEYRFASTESKNDNAVIIRPKNGKLSAEIIHLPERDIEIVTLTREECNRFYALEVDGKMQYLFSDHVLFSDGKNVYEEQIIDAGMELQLVQCGMSRYTVTIPHMETACEDILLRIDYRGDIGHLFGADGTLLSDNFSNGALWEIGLGEIGVKPGDVLTIYITPRKESVHIDVSSTMAGRQEIADGIVAEVRSISLAYVAKRVV